jgi:hypothetical protein
MNKDLKIYAIMTIAIVAIIIVIFYIKSYNNSDILDEATAKCIAAKSIIYSQTQCSHCMAQKQILGNYTSLFNITECDLSKENRQKCLDSGIEGTPTWVIDGKKYEGAQSIKQLKELTGC